MKKLLLLLTPILLAACTAPAPAPAPSAAPKEAPAVAAASEEHAPGEEEGVKTPLPAAQAGPFQVKAHYTGDLSLGHVNFYVEGGKPKAVRAWVGNENADGVMVGKADWEDDHYCAHLEVADPIPADAALWLEIEDEGGASHKASMTLH